MGKQCGTQRRNRVVVLEAFGNRVRQDQGSGIQRTHENSDIQNPQMFGHRVCCAFCVDQAGLGQVLVVLAPCGPIGMSEHGTGHGFLVGIPVRGLIEVPDVLQRLRELMPARGRSACLLIPVIKLLLLVGNEQLRSERIDQRSDGRNVYRQLSRRVNARLQGQEMFTVDECHRRTRQRDPHQHIGKRFIQITAGHDIAAGLDPGRSDDRGERRVNLQRRIKRVECRPQCSRCNLSDRGTGDQLGQYVICTRGSGVGHGRLLIEDAPLLIAQR